MDLPYYNRRHLNREIVFWARVNKGDLDDCWGTIDKIWKADKYPCKEGFYVTFK